MGNGCLTTGSCKSSPRYRRTQNGRFSFSRSFPNALRAVGDLLGGFPANAWLGCIVDAQARVATAERAFRDMKASVRWLSVEPMRERLVFSDLSPFDWLVMGGQTVLSQFSCEIICGMIALHHPLGIMEE